MPKCNLTQDFYFEVLLQKPDRTMHYYDKDIPNFMLEHRPSGEVTWYYRYETYSGKMKFYRLGKNRRMDAVEARKQAYITEMLIAEGKDPAAGGTLLRNEPVKFLHFVENTYLPFAKVKKRSWQHDRFMLKKYIYPYFAQSDVHKITSLDLSNWQKSLSESGLAFSTCNRILALVKVIFRNLIRFEIIDKNNNPCDKLLSFKEAPARERFLSHKEAQKLIGYLNASGNVQGAAFIKLLLFTGARKSEILKAKWQDVNWEQKMLTVPLSKSGKARHIALSAEALDVLRHLPGKGGKWLFPNASGKKPISCPYYLWDKARKACHIEDVRLHDLRHSYASFMVNNGCSLYEVQKVLGHSDPRVTQRYAHLDAKSILSAVNKTSKAIAKK